MFKKKEEGPPPPPLPGAPFSEARADRGPDNATGQGTSAGGPELACPACPGGSYFLAVFFAADTREVRTKRVVFVERLVGRVHEDANLQPRDVAADPQHQLAVELWLVREGRRAGGR